MVGKLLPYVVIGLIQTTIILIVGRLLFSVPVVGRLLDLYVAALVFIAATLGLGLFVSTLAQTQFQAFQLAFFTMLPSILLSGFMFPFEGMPAAAQWIAQVLPLTHFNVIIRGIMLRGADLPEVWPQLPSSRCSSRHDAESPWRASRSGWTDRPTEGVQMKNDSNGCLRSLSPGSSLGAQTLPGGTHAQCHHGPIASSPRAHTRRRPASRYVLSRRDISLGVTCAVGARCNAPASELGNHSLFHACPRALLPDRNQYYTENYDVGRLLDEISRHEQRVLRHRRRERIRTYLGAVQPDHRGRHATTPRPAPLGPREIRAQGRRLNTNPSSRDLAHLDLFRVPSWGPVDSPDGKRLIAYAERVRDTRRPRRIAVPWHRRRLPRGTAEAHRSCSNSYTSIRKSGSRRFRTSWITYAPTAARLGRHGTASSGRTSAALPRAAHQRHLRHRQLPGTAVRRACSPRSVSRRWPPPAAPRRACSAVSTAMSPSTKRWRRRATHLRLDRPARVGGPRERIRRCARRHRQGHSARGGDRPGRRLHRRCHGPQGRTHLRSRLCHRARRGRRRSGTQTALSVHADRARRELSTRQTRSRRHDRRLQAFERAGADVLFAPGLPDLAAVRTVCASVNKPVNFMVGHSRQVVLRRGAGGSRRAPHQPRRARCIARP